MARKTIRNHPDPETHEQVKVRRKGHWRLQKCGPDRALTRKVKVKSYFVTIWRPKGANYELPFGKHEA